MSKKANNLNMPSTPVRLNLTLEGLLAATVREVSADTGMQYTDAARVLLLEAAEARRLRKAS